MHDTALKQIDFIFALGDWRDIAGVSNNDFLFAELKHVLTSWIKTQLLRNEAKCLKKKTDI